MHKLGDKVRVTYEGIYGGDDGQWGLYLTPTKDYVVTILEYNAEREIGDSIKNGKVVAKSDNYYFLEDEHGFPFILSKEGQYV